MTDRNNKLNINAAHGRKKVIVAPDSFKGTMNAKRICLIFKEAFSKYAEEYDVDIIPIADGGEGTADCFIAAGAEKTSLCVTSPFGEKISAYYAVMVKDGVKSAVIESAQAAGLQLASGRENPLIASTYGVGELILHAVQLGCTQIVIGLGGTCTNDMGAGMAAALGMKFFDSDGRSFVPTGSTLCKVRDYDDTELRRNLCGVKIKAMCDVENPLYGENGAAFVFAPQKGADENEVKLLDMNLRSLACVIERKMGFCISDIKGGGAAGGMGAMIAGIMGGKLCSGADEILSLTDFDLRAAKASFIITGEGRLDRQSVNGKAVSGVCRRALRLKVPVIAIAGDVCEIEDELYKMGVCSVFSINRRAVSFAEAKKTCAEDLKRTAEAIAGMCRILG